MCRFLVRHFPAVLGLQFHKLAAVFLLLPLHLLLQQLNALITSGDLALQGAVVGFKLFQFAASQKRTDLCHKCSFCLGLGGFQLLRLDFLPHFVKLPFRLLLLVLQLPHVGFKLSRLPFQVTVVLGGGGVPCF